MAGKRHLLIVFIVLLLITRSGESLIYARTYQDHIQKFVELAKEAYTQSNIQGMAVVTVEGQTDNLLCMGETDKNAVSEDTLFELGSISKSFTALAVYYMEGQGLIKLEADIREYIPELSFDYSKLSKNSLDGKTPVTVRNLIYHTSGIPWISTVYLPEGGSEDMLEETVLGKNPIELAAMPGERYCYASVNYDILGLLIQRISGMSYERYMEQVIFPMLGMNHTYVYDVPEEESVQLSPGYEFLFFQTEVMQTPDYRGNEPAGYIISCIRDMRRWMGILLGQIEVAEELQEAVEQEFSFVCSGEVKEDAKYSSGWFWNPEEKRFYHGGSNPGFSSMISVDRSKRLGICILTNQNSSLPDYLADSYFMLLRGEKPEHFPIGGMRLCDMVCTGILIIIAFLLLKTFIQIGFMVTDIVKKKRRFQWRIKKKSIVLRVFFFCFTSFVIWGVMDQYIWRAVYVWLPKTVTFSLEGCFIYMLVMTGNWFIRSNFPSLMKKDKQKE